MSRPFKVVDGSGEPPPPTPFEEWRRAEAYKAIDEALALNPMGILIIVEPKDDTELSTWRIPDSQHLQDGIIKALAEGRINEERAHDQ
jgi:hypothetical protein